MSELPSERGRPASPPARQLNTRQMEAVVRRAVELQAQESDRAGETGVTEDELLRIGAELGIEAAHLRRALAEVSAEPLTAEHGGGGLLGPAKVTASRTVPGTAETVARQVERYLVESQYLAVLRRLPDRTVYEKSSGLPVAFARVVQAARDVAAGRGHVRIGAGFDLRTARSVEVAVRPLDEGSCWLTFTVDLANQRTGYWVGVNSGAGTGAAAAAVFAGIAIAPVAALVAVPSWRLRHGALASPIQPSSSVCSCIWKPCSTTSSGASRSCPMSRSACPEEHTSIFRWRFLGCKLAVAGGWD